MTKQQIAGRLGVAKNKLHSIQQLITAQRNFLNSGEVDVSKGVNEELHDLAKNLHAVFNQIQTDVRKLK